ncbi:MAG: hypothetical protein U1E59_20765 [Amaricoccus sp.]
MRLRHRSAGDDRRVETGRAARRRCVAVGRLAIGLVDEEPRRGRLAAHQLEDRLDLGQRRPDAARVLRAGDADEPRPVGEERRDQVGRQPIAPVEVKPAFAHGDPGAEQRVARRRKAGRRDDRLVAGAAELEGEQEQAERGPLRGEDVFRPDPGERRDRGAQSRQAGRGAVADRQPAERRRAAGQIEELAEGQVPGRALGEIVSPVDVQQGQDLVAGKARLPVRRPVHVALHAGCRGA